MCSYVELWSWKRPLPVPRHSPLCTCRFQNTWPLPAEWPENHPLGSRKPCAKNIHRSNVFNQAWFFSHTSKFSALKKIMLYVIYLILREKIENSFSSHFGLFAQQYLYVFFIMVFSSWLWLVFLLLSGLAQKYGRNWLSFASDRADLSAPV